MTAIQRLNSGTLSAGSSIPFYDPANGRDLKASISELATLLQSLLSVDDDFMSQYAVPGATGFSVTVAPQTAGQSVFLLLSPGGAYAAGTLVLPTGVDGQQLLVHCRQAVTALTVTPATDNNISGAPTTLAAGGFFRLRFDGVNKLWCRVG